MAVGSFAAIWHFVSIIGAARVEMRNADRVA